MDDFFVDPVLYDGRPAEEEGRLSKRTAVLRPSGAIRNPLPAC